jgi:acetolactate synthase-1/2/3 large subunit
MEGGRFGARTVPIGWGQEMRDQTALVRESVKFDYELRFPEQVQPMLDRAWAVAMSTPRGPVYLSLPREVLCEPVDPAPLSSGPAMHPARAAPDPQAIARAARILADAQRPLIIAQRGAGDAESFAAFADWVSDWAIPVASWWATHLAIDTDHPCHIGADPGRYMAEADAVVILDCLAPWWPDRHALDARAKVINAGPDPLFSRFPARTFPSDVTIQGESVDIIPAMIAAMEGLPRDTVALAERRTRIARDAGETRARLAEASSARNAKGISKAWISRCLSEALEGVESSVFSELGTILGQLERRGPRAWFQEPHSGGLGWSFPAALGAKLAVPERTIVATMGDGSYMFANPTACHQVAEALGLGILVIVLNNAEWGAVRASVGGLYPEGAAARTNTVPLTSLKPIPDFTRTAEASRAWARRVTDPKDVLGAIEEALEVTRGGRLALLDIQTLPD